MARSSGYRNGIYPLGGEEGQDYLISVSDMMAGLIFLFIITLVVFVITFHDETSKKTKQLDVKTEELQQAILEKERTAERLESMTVIQRKRAEELATQTAELLKQTEELQQAIAEKERTAQKLKNISELYRKKTEELIQARATRARLLRELQETLATRGVHVRIDPDHGILRMPEEILFPSGSAELEKEGRANLQKLARALHEIVPCYCGSKSTQRPESCPRPATYRPGTLEAVLVEGHTDNVPLKGGRLFQDNWELSAKRSIVTYQAMLMFQPDLDQLQNQNGQPLFSVSGYADTRPVVRHEKETPEPRNRRIDLRFLLAPPSIEKLTVIETLENAYGH